MGPGTESRSNRAKGFGTWGPWWCLPHEISHDLRRVLTRAALRLPFPLAASVVNRFHSRGESTAGALNQSMIGALFRGCVPDTGRRGAGRKQTVDDLDVRRTRILFGDPAVEAQAGR